MGRSEDDLDHVRHLLRSAVERLDDVAFRELREAVAKGATGRPELERRIVRARNAILRALPLLESDEVPDDIA